MLSKPIIFVVQIKALSDKENNLLSNEKWRVRQNINKFISGVEKIETLWNNFELLSLLKNWLPV